MNDNVIISAQDLKKYYNGDAIKALDGVSTDINKGEVVVVIGKKFSESLKSFIALFGADVFFNGLLGKVRLQSIRKGTANIAGVNVPTFEAAVFEETEYDPFRMPWSFRDAIKALQDFVSLKEAYVVLEEQHRLLNDELRTTTQRVNLFEKVKIPECKANIRTIGIQLGDLSTAAVARSKIAKKKTMEANAL